MRVIHFINGSYSLFILCAVSDKPDFYALVHHASVLYRTRLVNGMVYPLDVDRNHKDRIAESPLTNNTFLM